MLKCTPMNLPQIIENSFYFLVLINPISKILFITSKHPAYSRQKLISICMRSNMVALSMLVLLASIGDFLMTKIFHVEIYSLSVAGGIILFSIGLTAVRTGNFFENSKKNHSHEDVSIVPLAAPLIAGPGSMTAAISFASMQGTVTTIVCMTIAILINLVCMLFSFKFNKFLEKFKATEPLTRITGLIVTAVAMQMIFSGCATWFNRL